MKAREKNYLYIFFIKELFVTLNIARRQVTVKLKMTYASPSLSNLFYGWHQCVSRSYQIYQNGAVSNQLTDGRRGGGRVGGSSESVDLYVEGWGELYTCTHG